MTAPMCTEHRMPVVECEGVRLAGHERWRDVLIGAVTAATKVFVVAYLVAIVGGAALIVGVVVWSLIRAVIGR